MFGSNHREKIPFDCTDQSIEFICCELRRHGFGFLLDEDLDEHQLDLFMIASWAILRNIHGKPHQYPNNLTLEVLSQHDKTQEIFASIANEDGWTATVPSYLEASCKTCLRCSLPSRDIDFTANNAEDTVKYQYSMPIAGCIPKHHRRHPAIKGNGYTGAVLSDTKTFVLIILE
jgi:hypothetical protein